ncbi:hypothetical protein ACEPAG_9175 [Sanghuangporus baumii]
MRASHHHSESKIHQQAPPSLILSYHSTKVMIRKETYLRLTNCDDQEHQPGFALKNEHSPFTGHNGDLSAVSRDFHFPTSPGNRDIFLTPSLPVPDDSASFIVSDILTKTNHPNSSTGTTHREFILAPHDIDVLRRIEEESAHPKSEGTLQILLAKRSDLNIGGKIHDSAYTYHGRPDFLEEIGQRALHMVKTSTPSGFASGRWMENGTVLEYLRSNPDTDVLQLIIDIAEGLDCLHKCNVVHSDIKPDNVLISDSGEPLLCDFGVARMLLASETFHFSSSLTGGLRGTIRYLSKELLVASDQGITSYSMESDVWAFGMTSIAILERKPPYSRIKMDVQVILAISKGELPLKSSTFSSWPLQNRIIWLICERCWTAPPLRPPLRYILYELSRLKLVNPVSTGQDDWLKYRFFWLDNVDFHKGSARSFLVTPTQRLSYRYSPYNIGNRTPTSHDLFPI